MDKETKELKKENKKLKKEIEDLKRVLKTDPLTGLQNKESFKEHLEDACQRTMWITEHKDRRKQKDQFSLIIIDIDDFKKYNDQFGHIKGDELLKKTANLLEKSVRKFDVVSRWGGEEFAIILRNIKEDQAEKRAKSIIEKARKKLPITLSAGLIHSSPEHTPEKIFEKADKLLYKAKNQGKNQVVI
ncbi:MAG: diguanylate cyclase [Candidatus Portnoybacteria bacterium]|nr:diguanylate cyclase [Candidatus Portnoybacteria bacterium]